MKARSIAVVGGGACVEAEVSRASAAGVTKALASAGYQACQLELDAHLAERLRTGGFDVVFPAAHGALGEDGSLQGLLEILGIPYVGSGVLASALAMHKGRARTMFAAEGLPIAKGMAIARGDARAAAAAVRDQLGRIGRGVVVKPASSGSAIGVVRLEESADLAAVEEAIAGVWRSDDVAIVEHFAKGLEVTCSVLDLHGESPRALACTTIVSPHDPFYTYEARYAPGRSVHQCPSVFASPDLTRKIEAVAVAAHRALGCRDLSRVDFVIGDEGDPDRIVLLEVNTSPGFTRTSLYPEAAASVGLDFPALCNELVKSAERRGPTPRSAPRPLP